MFTFVKKILDHRTSNEKYTRFYDISSEIDDINYQLDQYAEEFTSKNEIYKSITHSDDYENSVKHQVSEKFSTFRKSYGESLLEAINKKEALERERIDLLNDKSIVFRDLKKSFLSGGLDAAMYLKLLDNIEKAKNPNAKVAKVMREFYAGSLKSGSGATVTSKDQALAIAMSEAGMSKSNTDEEEEKESLEKSKYSLEDLAKEFYAPVEVLDSIFEKGIVSWGHGERLGISQNDWALARVKSVLNGGKAREIDSKEWQSIIKYRTTINKSNILSENEIQDLFEKSENGMRPGKYNSGSMTLEGIAKKHGVSPELVQKQLSMGIKTEMEHTDNKDEARKIALDHLYEIHDYYTRLKELEDEHKDEMDEKKDEVEKYATDKEHRGGGDNKDLAKADYFHPEDGTAVDRDMRVPDKTITDKVIKAFEVIQEAMSKANLNPFSFYDMFEKAKAGVYADNEYNRKLGRVGEKYGEDDEDDKPSKKKDPAPKDDKKPKIDVGGSDEDNASEGNEESPEEKKDEGKKEVKLDVPNNELKKIKAQAKEASASSLQSAVKESKDPKIRATAQEELDRRKSQEVATI